MMTIKEYAQNQGVTYEAIRKQLKRYASELDGHIHQIGRRQFLDDFAMDFINEKRNDSPIIQRQQDKDDEIKELNQQLAKALAENGRLNQIIGKQGEKIASLAEQNSKVLQLEQSVQSKNEKIKQLEDAAAAQTAEIADFKALVADKDKSLEDGKKQLQEEQQAHLNTASDLAETETKLSSANAEIAALKAENEKIKNSSLFSRIFKKW